MNDIFGRAPANIQLPITGDTAVISWSGNVIASATSLSIGAQQPIMNKHTLGNQFAVIIPGMPGVSLGIGRLLVPVDAKKMFTYPGWRACDPATFVISFSTCSAGEGIAVRIEGCVIASWQLQAEAEGTTVLDSVNIQGLQIFLA